MPWCLRWLLRGHRAMRHSNCSNKQVLTFGTDLTAINLWCIDRGRSLDQYPSSRGSIDQCFLDTDKENRI